MKMGNAIEKMIVFYDGNHHSINHFLKVYAYAKTLGELEGIPEVEQESLELAAIVHDIACPLCWERYGHANGKVQEEEGPPLARKLLGELDLDETLIDRVCYLVGHHHTYTDVDGMDYQILLEADYLVNADEGQYSAENIRSAMDKIFKTETGRRLLKSMYMTLKS